LHRTYFWRWVGGSCLALLIVAIPFLHYRQTYWYGKRLRAVTPGKVYRSGQMTADGLRAAIARFGIRTVINLQEEAPDPEMTENYFGGGCSRESDVCAAMGVRFVFLDLDMVPRAKVAEQRPSAIDRFLKVLDDQDNYPVLIHCRAGLHRTGVMTAVYRMEYEGWPTDRALRELKGNGFGDNAATAANDYIMQYVLAFKPGLRPQGSGQPAPRPAALEGAAPDAFLTSRPHPDAQP